MKVSRVFDAGYVNSVLRNPTIYAETSDDNSVPIHDVDVSLQAAEPGYYFLVPELHDGRMGVVIGHSMDHGTTIEVHANILPQCRGDGRGRTAVKVCLQWLFDNTKCTRLRARIPQADFGVAAMRTALSLGFRGTGIIKGSCVKGGQVYDETIYFLERRDVKWDS